MKEILQLFRRDAEHAPPRPDAAKYDLGAKPRILKEASRMGGSGSSSGRSSREASVIMTGERRVSPPVGAKPKPVVPREDALYGRRW
jgi:hypothetical protein